MPSKKTPVNASAKAGAANAAGGHILCQKPGLWACFLSAFCWKRFFIQLFCVLLLLCGLHYFYSNAVENLTRQHIASGFGFLDMRAGISIPDSLIPYDSNSTYKTALLAGLVNTVFMAVLCIVAATILGFCIAFGRLSKNWLLAKLCLFYVEIFRNIPVLLVILFFYFGLMQQYLPPVRDSFVLPFHIYVNQRGLYFPALHWEGAFWGRDGLILPCLLFVFALLALFALRPAGLNISPFLRHLLKIIIGAACIAALYCFWRGFGVDMPQQGRFNIMGGGSIPPEFSALFLGLSCYSAALIAETARAGVEGVDKGLKEAAASLGMTGITTVRTIIIPLALRIIVPPLAGQYMNIAKNTSLAVAIGYSDLMRIGNTVVIQTNQAVEVVLIWIIAYLAICLLISALMNMLNHRLLFMERLG
ncbi:amino acid ABC transporter permease [Candidatus Tokpelaia sp.]|nr:amino acid ABC transporter permease [Candidatus Tokpelaia sp.]